MFGIKKNFKIKRGRYHTKIKVNVTDDSIKELCSLTKMVTSTISEAAAKSFATVYTINAITEIARGKRVIKEDVIDKGVVQLPEQENQGEN